jgi:hypothetical protein
MGGGHAKTLSMSSMRVTRLSRLTVRRVITLSVAHPNLEPTGSTRRASSRRVLKSILEGTTNTSTHSAPLFSPPFSFAPLATR